MDRRLPVTADFIHGRAPLADTAADRHRGDE
jgi:hypothetical protein